MIAFLRDLSRVGMDFYDPENDDDDGKKDQEQGNNFQFHNMLKCLVRRGSRPLCHKS
jgi:hypothetical protein